MKAPNKAPTILDLKKNRTVVLGLAQGTITRHVSYFAMLQFIGQTVARG